MSRWIDADAFVADSKWCGLETAEQVLFALAHQPSIEIVRCKECKHYEDPNHKIFENCVKWKESHGIILPTKPNDSCSYGEREGE